jgi:DNA-3-methyladenine glycosylase II
MTLTVDQKHAIILQDMKNLQKHDAVFSKMDANAAEMIRTRGNVDMAGLIRIVIGQQISNKVATNLWSKLTTDINPNDPDQILNAPEDQLKSYGLSRQKIVYVRGLANRVQLSEIDIQSWVQKDDETVRAEILSHKGFGPWSAQIFMMFHLCHRHIWPAGDLGIQIGLQKYFKLDDRPNEKEAEAMKSHFKGHETAASYWLWALKGDSAF